MANIQRPPKSRALRCARRVFSVTGLATVFAGCKAAPLAPPAADGSALTTATTIAFGSDPLEPALVSFESGSLRLQGFLYRPSGAGPFPAIVFNHGSEALPGPKRGQAAFYVPRGFALFVPHRRG